MGFVVLAFNSLALGDTALVSNGYISNTYIGIDIFSIQINITREWMPDDLAVGQGNSLVRWLRQ